MPRHDGVNIGCERRERREVRGRNGLAVAQHARRRGMRISARIAVAGKVFQAACSAALGESGDGFGPRPGDGIGIGTEGSHPDDGIRGLGCHVDNGSEIEVDVAGGQQVTEVPPALARLRHPGRARIGQGGAVFGLQPRNVAALLVDRDDYVGLALA